MAKTPVVNTASIGLAKLAAAVPQWASQALNEEAEETMTDAKALTPVDTGRLRRSGRVRLSTPKHLKARLTFSTNYAVWVHEIPAPPDKSYRGRSATHAPPTQWKYLETPVNARSLTFGQRIGSEIKKKLTGANPATSNIG
jgi:hypothetical protein